MKQKPTSLLCEQPFFFTKAV